MDVKDDVEIRNLIGRMAWLTDHWSTPEEYLDNCTEDFSWQIEGFQAYVGHAGMKARLQEMVAAGICGPGLATRHHVTSMEVIPGATPDVAKVQSFVLMTAMTPTGPAMVGYGDYHDDVRKVGGRWLMAKRFCVSFWEGPKGSSAD